MDVERTPALAHLDRREAGEEHRQVDRSARGAVGVSEAEAGLVESAENPGLIGDPHAAAGQDERPAGTGVAGRRGEMECHAAAPRRPVAGMSVAGASTPGTGAVGGGSQASLSPRFTTLGIPSGTTVGGCG